MRDIDYDDLNWMSANLRIVTMEGDLAPLRCNEAQLKVHNTLEAQRRAGYPVRALVLKARREGVSTYTEGRFFRKVNTFPRRTACVVSADLDSTNKVFKMVRLFQDHIPSPRPTDYSNRKEITYSPPHMGSLVCQTAGKDVLGRGGLTHYLHCTEFAFWNNAKEQLGGAQQEVPDDPDTEIIIESTANGVGGAFYDMYMQAYEDFLKGGDFRNFLPIFLPWYGFHKYVLEPGVRAGVADAPWVLDEWLADEEELVEKHGCSSEQLAWRRWAIKNKCQGDLSLFRQEYPATVTEAFQSSGRPVFAHSLLDRQKCPDYRLFGLFKGLDDPEWIPINRRMNCWILTSRPHPYHQYMVAVDTMEGRLSNVQDEKSKQDRHAAVVYDRTANEFVGLLWATGEFTQKDIAQQCYAACHYFNEAWFAPEIPNGMEVLNYFRERGYENILNRSAHDEQMVTDEGDNLGWRTTSVTRPWLVEGFKTTLSEGIKLSFPELIDEMRSFIYDKNGKPIHMSGKHDDILFAAMIAIEAHKKCPLDDVPVPFGFTEEIDGEIDDMRDVIEEDEKEELWLFTG